jgi:hypothetical protein
VKALTLTQPWATLIALGEKRVETRGWAINQPQRIAIHAAKGLAEPVCNEDGLREWVAAEPFADALGRHGVTVAEQLPRAAIVATVDVIACLPTHNLRARMGAVPSLADFEAGEFERDFGDYTLGRYAWLLDNLQVFDSPVPARGGQKLWDWSES